MEVGSEAAVEYAADPSVGRGAFREYYARQRLLASSDDWRRFGTAMRSPLPVTFRMCTLPSRKAAAEACWAQGIALAKEAEHASGRVGQALPWCHGYQLGYSKVELRADQSAAAQRLQRWLVAATDDGLVVRQEVVSMLPAALLRVRPTDAVLDMCAAPGSKTSQLVEAIAHGDSGGVVVANDASPRRAYMLAHRIRARGDDLNVVVVTHRGQTIPRTEQRAGCDGSGARRFVGEYDRVLCDVPCSGDGTLRKEPSLWARWRPGLGLQLHTLQLQLAMRAAALLKVGGLLAYSTCSLNPIEDEAVVSALLLRNGGSLQLVDASDRLPELQRLPGIAKWQVIDDEMRLLHSFEQTQSSKKRRAKLIQRVFSGGKGGGGRGAGRGACMGSTIGTGIPGQVGGLVEGAARGVQLNTSSGSGVQTDGSSEFERCIAAAVARERADIAAAEACASRRRWRRSMFPPPAAIAASLHLERCMRFMPHLHAGGGFFIALLLKTAPLPAGKRAEKRRRSKADEARDADAYRREEEEKAHCMKRQRAERQAGDGHLLRPVFPATAGPDASEVVHRAAAPGVDCSRSACDNAPRLRVPTRVAKLLGLEEEGGVPRLTVVHAGQKRKTPAVGEGNGLGESFLVRGEH